MAKPGGGPKDKPILIFSRDGWRLVASPVGAMEVPVWDIESRTRWLVKIDHREGLVWAALSADGTRLVAASYDDHASLWDVETGRKLARFSGQFVGFLSAAISPDKTRVALGGDDGSLSVWDAQTGQQMATFRGNSSAINFTLWDENGDTLATVSGTDGLRIWRAPALAEIKETERSRGQADTKVAR